MIQKIKFKFKYQNKNYFYAALLSIIQYYSIVIAKLICAIEVVVTYTWNHSSYFTDNIYIVLVISCIYLVFDGLIC